MKAAVYHEARHVRVEDVPDPSIVEPTDVIVKTRTTSICGSDLYLYLGEADALVAKGRTTIGHEIVGEVVEVGDNVARFRVGDRITVPYSVSCGTCFSCRVGQTAHCETSGKAIYGFGVAFGDLGGTQAEYVRVPLADGHAEHVPEGITDEQGLFLSCNLPAAVKAVEEAGIAPPQTVAVLGCGPTGLLALHLVLLRGPAKVLAFDKVDHRLQAAKELGAETYNVDQVDPVQAAQEATGGRGVDAVVEFVGRGPAFAAAAAMTRPGGVISGGGVFLEQDFPTSLFDLYFKNLRIHLNGFANAKTRMWEAAQLILAGTIEPSRLLSHRFKLSEAADAFRTFEAKADGVFKVLVTPD
jgi:threonine dehydrogenase-like Zn-dependent dehydrogenase